MKRKVKIKTIDVNAKEWFDRVNGNSYYSVRVTLNYGTKTERTLVAPLQYGYGDCYMQTAYELVKAYNGEEPRSNGVLWVWCKDNGVILRYNKQENVRKAEVDAFGKGDQ